MREVQEEIMFEQEFLSFGKETDNSRERDKEGERRGDRETGRQLHCRDKEARRDRHA